MEPLICPSHIAPYTKITLEKDRLYHIQNQYGIHEWKYVGIVREKTEGRETKLLFENTGEDKYITHKYAAVMPSTRLDNSGNIYVVLEIYNMDNDISRLYKNSPQREFQLVQTEQSN